MFTSAPALYPADNGWKLKSSLVYQYGETYLVVPADTFTDLASIPKWLPLVRVLFNPGAGKDRYAAVLHDYLYQIKWRTRKECDQVLLLALKECGVSWMKRRSMYAGVRAGGWTRGNW